MLARPQVQRRETATVEAANINGVALWHRAVDRLFVPVDAASLALLRIAFGLIMLWEVWRYYHHGWIEAYWIAPTFHFTYPYLGWLQPWPGNVLYIHMALLALCALCIAAGIAYRLSAALFFLGFTYLFLLDQSTYLNHFYLISLLSFLLIVVPAHRAFAVDALLRRTTPTATVPTWALWLLRAQIAIPYFYGGIAKLNADWLAGEPMRLWLADRNDYGWIGPYVTHEWLVYLFSYGGLLFDLAIVPLLLWRRTRLWAYLVAVAFHLTNAWLFSIGIFPWFMVAATLIFFPPSWPRKLFSWGKRARLAAPPAQHPVATPRRGLIVAGLALYLAVQLLVPLRHLLYPGNVSWTEEGHNFAWHMKLRDKAATARFTVVSAAGERQLVEPRQYLSARQARKMAGRPQMIGHFAHYLARRAREEGTGPVAVYADVRVALNGRSPQLLVDPTANLVDHAYVWFPTQWILPLEPVLETPLSAEW